MDVTKNIQGNASNGHTPVDSKAQGPAKTKESTKTQESAKDVIKSIANTKNMDEANKQAYNVLMNGTKNDFIKHVFTEQSTGRVRSYAEMRYLYG